MRVQSLRLENFRNIPSLFITPGEGVNIIYGDNAQGKTNLLEAVWLLSGAKSFRGAKDGELTLFGEKKAVIESEFFGEGRVQTSKILLDGKKTAWLNDIKQDSVTAFAGKFTAVVFSPAHLGIGHSRGNLGEQLFIIHSGIAVCLGQVVALVRDHGHIDLTTLLLQIGVVHILQAAEGMVQVCLPYRVIQLGCVAVHDINIVVILLLQHIVVGQGLQLPEDISAGELIQGVVLKLRHKFAVGDGLAAQLRELIQRATLRIRKIFGRAEPGKACKRCPNDHQNGCADGANIFRHVAALLRSGNTGTD